MKKIKMARGTTQTFEEGCNKYLENCRQRNLREGTIEHYRQSYVQFYKFFDSKMPIEDIDEQLRQIQNHSCRGRCIFLPNRRKDLSFSFYTQKI